jgi:hypothetical protein
MKLPTLLLTGSLVVNGVLLAVFSYRPTLAPTALRDFLGSRDAVAAREAERGGQAQRVVEVTEKKNAIQAAATQSRLWAALSPDDLPALVARLRAAGFPPSVIRAVVNAQLQARFSARINALAASVEDAPFWRPTPTSSFNNPKFFEDRSQIYRERSRLLRELLGDDFFATAGDNPTAAQRRQFGDLPKTKIEFVQRIEDDYEEMASQVRAATRGITLPEDREKLALLDREKHADLAAVLAAPELEDYELRSSPLTARLRPAATLMDATEDEFRAIFRIQQPLNDRLNIPGGAYNSDLAQQRREATAQMNEQLKAALGEARANEFTRASNFEFQQLAQLAQRENLPLSAAVSAYDLRSSTSQESLRISEDKSLTFEQQRAALQTLAQNTRAQLAGALGPTAGAAYAQSATWLQAIEKGTVVTFDGTTTMYRTLTPPRAPAK